MRAYDVVTRCAVEVRVKGLPQLTGEKRLELALQSCGARQVARGIATVLMVLAGASRLVGGRIRSPTHSSVASNNASTPNVRRTNAVSGVNSGRWKRAVCSSVFVRIYNSTGAPACAASPTSDYYLSLDLSGYPTAIEEASDTDRLLIINLTGLSLWITCRAERSSCCPMFGRTGRSMWGGLVVSGDDVESEMVSSLPSSYATPSRHRSGQTY
jgi:hypothetical protein